MAIQVQRRRGTTTDHSTFTGAPGELTVDTTKNTVVVHDGATAGGFPLAKESALAAKVDATDPRLSDAREPTSHTHSIAAVSGLQTALDSKVSASHSHAISDVTGLQTALDGKVGTDALAEKQDILVSGTNIKTIGGQDLLGSGDVSVKTINGESVLGSGNISVTGVPAGCVVHFAMSSAPTGWLKANGALVSRTTYAELFAAIGTTFGAGNGSTTFALPDLRGEFLRVWDDGRGVDSGRALGSAQAQAVQSHNHAVTNTSHVTSGVAGSRRPHASNGNGAQGDWSTDNAGGPETRPRNVAMLACIKF